jgi:hypothetical protein
MRRLVAVLFVSVACAGGARPPERPYRISARPSQAPTGNDVTDVQRLGDGVEYATKATVAADVVRIRTVIGNAGKEPVLYDLDEMVVAGADGGLLRLVDREPEVSGSLTDGAPGHVRHIHPGQYAVIVRRFELADGLRRGRDPLLAARLSIRDAVRVGDREARVALRLDEVR